MRLFRLAPAPLACLAVAARTPVAAQPPAARAVVVGTVRDSAGAPVAGASVELDRADRWLPVAADGAFRLPDVAPGEHTVRARAVGYAEGTARVVVAGGGEARVALVLRRAATSLDTLRTVAAPTRRYGPADFDERRRGGRGVFITRGDFESRAPSRMSDLLLRIPGIERRPYTTDYGGTDYQLVFRGTATIKGKACPPALYVDGKPFDLGNDDIDRFLRPNDVDAVEVYRTGGHVPAQFVGPTSRCGVIVLWTRATSAGPG